MQRLKCGEISEVLMDVQAMLVKFDEAVSHADRWTRRPRKLAPNILCAVMEFGSCALAFGPHPRRGLSSRG